MFLKTLHLPQRGSSLIEVLVSIVIASVGLLALAGVNAAALRYAKLTQYRATAAQLANDIGERMRANKAGFVAGHYDYGLTFETQQTDALTAPSELCNQSISSCSALQIATADLWQWRKTVRTNLPKGSVFIKRDSAVLGADTWVVWLDPSVVNIDERPSTATECPDDLERGGDTSIRCMFFRINL